MKAENIVKGYEYAKDKRLTLQDEDFEKMQIESTHAVEITDFIEQSQIHPKFYYKPYFLEAQKGGEKAYTLLHKALTQTGKVGIAKVSIRNREYLAAVKTDGLFLILDQKVSGSSPDGRTSSKSFKIKGIKDGATHKMSG